MTTFRSALDDQLQGYLDHLTIERGVAAKPSAARSLHQSAARFFAGSGNILVRVSRGFEDPHGMPVAARLGL